MKSAEAFLAELSKKSGADLGLSADDLSTKQAVDNSSKAGRACKSNDTGNVDTLQNVERLKQQIEAKAVALLAMREHGARELKQKLLSKFVETAELLESVREPPGVVERLVGEVISQCQQNNWQSDDRYLEQAVASYVSKGQGPLKIKQRLQQACHDSSLIDVYLDLAESDWVESARSVLEKKYGDCNKPASHSEQAKRMRFLQSRGFYQGVIWKAFD